MERLRLESFTIAYISIKFTTIICGGIDHCNTKPIVKIYIRKHCNVKVEFQCKMKKDTIGLDRNDPFIYKSQENFPGENSC